MPDVLRAHALPVSALDVALDGLLQLVLLPKGKGHAVRVPELEAVILGRVMGGGDNDAAVIVPGGVRQRGRRCHADACDSRPHGQQPGYEGILDHRAGRAGVPADDDALVRQAERPAGL